MDQHAQLLAKAFAAQREFLVMASKSKAPSADALPGLLAETSKAIGDVTSFSETNRKTPFPNHLAAVASAVPALGWVMVTPKPAPHVKEMHDSAQFYSNRVLKDFKDTKPEHVAWAKGFNQVLTDLFEYVKKVHTTGLVWNPKGADAKAPAAAPAPAAAAAPTPAPAAAAAAPAPGAAAKAGLFAALNAAGDGGASGFGLKKVEKSQMTHKNPALRGTSVVPGEHEPKPAASAAAPKAAPAAKSPPVFELRDRKWVVEFQEGNKEIVIEADMKQTVYIYKCNNSTIQIKGKVNSVTCDGCKKTAVVFEDCIGAFEFVNCQSMQVQVLGALATLSIDKTDGAQVYLSKGSVNANIITAKSSEMNILVPGDDGDFTEHPVPEQFKTRFDPATKKLITTINEIAG